MNKTLYTSEEFLAAVLMRLLRDADNINVGNTSPIPAAATLAEYERGGQSTPISILGSAKYNRLFTGGIREHYDLATKGKVDVQFFSGAQIDGQANINLLGVGSYPPKVRLAGSFGSGLQYYVGRRTILFRQEHSRRVFVPNVDFISAPGVSPPGVFRHGGPIALVTGLCSMRFCSSTAQFVLQSIHPGHGLDDIRRETGFDFGVESDLHETAGPSLEELALLRGFARREVAEVYPKFAASAFLGSAT
jgi:glutaconate CoA-transferase subunit B